MMGVERRLSVFKRACYFGTAVIGAGALAASQTFDPTRQFGTYGPALLPSILGAGLVLLGIAGLIRPARVTQSETEYDPKQFASAILVMIVYVALFRPLGFLLDTMIASVLLVVFTVREHRRVALVGLVAFVALVYFLLHNVLQTQFPTPPWLNLGFL
ncbi:MAG TPA: tripartite tricarboxylate transporter TctB family protein [Candidatus Baltobacteraceae bacterium]|jgi:Ca2+/Na+ antiporter